MLPRSGVPARDTTSPKSRGLVFPKGDIADPNVQRGYRRASSSWVNRHGPQPPQLKTHDSCEIEGFVETYLCKLCAILRSRSLRGGVCLSSCVRTNATGGGGGGCTQSVHGRSRVTIDPRIPTMPGRSTSSFHQPGRHCWHQARSAVRCSASRMKGEVHPSKNRSYDGLQHLVPTFLLMNDSANELLCYLGLSLQRQHWVLL